MNRCIVFFVLTFCINCTSIDEKKESIQDEVFPEVFDSLLPKVEGKNILILQNFEEDNLKYLALEKFVDTSNYDKTILNSLRQSLDNNFELDYNFIDNNSGFLIYQDPEKVDSVFKHSPDKILGVVSIYGIVKGADGKEALFYFAPQLGENGGGVFLIKLVKKELWEISKIDTLLIGE